MDYNDFSEFENVLYKLAKSDKYPTKHDAPLISPAIYKPNMTRANDNVTGWGGWAALDIDDFVGDIKTPTFCSVSPISSAMNNVHKPPLSLPW